jgi:hypothetical protein
VNGDDVIVVATFAGVSSFFISCANRDLVPTSGWWTDRDDVAAKSSRLYSMCCSTPAIPIFRRSRNR